MAGAHSNAYELAMKFHRAPTVPEKTKEIHDSFAHGMLKKIELHVMQKTCTPAVQEIACNAKINVNANSTQTERCSGIAHQKAKCCDHGFHAIHQIHVFMSSCQSSSNHETLVMHGLSST
eukprot:2070507-Karenia_brevis.AAC.1